MSAFQNRIKINDDLQISNCSCRNRQVKKKKNLKQEVTSVKPEKFRKFHQIKTKTPKCVNENNKKNFKYQAGYSLSRFIHVIRSLMKIQPDQADV